MYLDSNVDGFIFQNQYSHSSIDFGQICINSWLVL